MHEIHKTRDKLEYIWYFLWYMYTFIYIHIYISRNDIINLSNLSRLQIFMKNNYLEISEVLG